MSEEDNDRTEALNPASVATISPRARLYCVDVSVLKDARGAQILLDAGEVSIGRDPENQISLRAEGVSRRHARVFADSGHWLVEDIGSTNGTRVNNSELKEIKRLRDGDTVAFGRACYKFELRSEISKASVPGIEIDLGATDKIMHDSIAQLASAAPNVAGPDAQAVAPRPAPAAKAVATKRSGSSNLVRGLIVLVAFTALVLGIARVLDFL